MDTGFEGGPWETLSTLQIMAYPASRESQWSWSPGTFPGPPSACFYPGRELRGQPGPPSLLPLTLLLPPQALLKLDCQGLVVRLIQDFVLLTTAVEVAQRWRELAEKLAKVSKQQMDAYESPHRDRNGVVDSEVSRGRGPQPGRRNRSRVYLRAFLRGQNELRGGTLPALTEWGLVSPFLGSTVVSPTLTLPGSGKLEPRGQNCHPG